MHHRDLGVLSGVRTHKACAWESHFSHISPASKKSCDASSRLGATEHVWESHFSIYIAQEPNSIRDRHTDQFEHAIWLKWILVDDEVLGVIFDGVLGLRGIWEKRGQAQIKEQ